ncbi:hypothetical protein ACFYOV_04930 [Streptomyces sp. NPDC005931]|uniref:hypothetical protein n=1 Tax=Streptomyces sp. NPDC005931 TaxID=3364737 RepID=UPI003699B7BE
MSGNRILSPSLLGGFVAERTATNDPRWNLAAQRSAVDGDFRARLLSDPQTALAEMGIEVGGLKLIVEEYKDDTLILVLPPLLSRRSSEGAGGEGGPYSTPRSPELVAPAMCALSEPDDDRVVYGQQK